MFLSIQSFAMTCEQLALANVAFKTYVTMKEKLDHCMHKNLKKPHLCKKKSFCENTYRSNLKENQNEVKISFSKLCQNFESLYGKEIDFNNHSQIEFLDLEQKPFSGYDLSEKQVMIINQSIAKQKLNTLNVKIMCIELYDIVKSN